MNKPQVLVIEDSRAIGNLLTAALETQEYSFKVARDGASGIAAAISQQPSVIILDLGLPDVDGIDIIKKMRGFSHVPIIVVSARSEDADKVAALDAGADDYLTKPFSIDEFMARLRVALRRVRFDSEKLGAEEVRYENGDLAIDYSAGCVYLKGDEVHLTPIEYKLLCALAKNTGKVLTHNYLLKEVWGNVLPTDTPSLRVFMATLRKKIEPVPSEPRYIQTHIGVGYRMLRV